MKFLVWLVMDNRGRLWRFENGRPVLCRTRADASRYAAELDPKRGWHAKRAEVTVSDEPNTHQRG